MSPPFSISASYGSMILSTTSTDLSYLAALLILISNIRRKRSCAGFSAKSHILLLITFIIRFADRFYPFCPLDLLIELALIFLHFRVLYLAYFKFSRTYYSEMDSANVYLLALLCTWLLFFTQYTFDIKEALSPFSAFLESVSIVPQSVVMTQVKDRGIITSPYLCALGLHRLCSLIVLVYQYTFYEYLNHIGIAAWVVETLLYGDYVFLFCKFGDTPSLLN
ncbi:unnamed protein product [Dicrocoelium dendriticum]|nr:unnamed protein product [Dicrocoelium dendriticum]